MKEEDFKEELVELATGFNLTLISTGGGRFGPPPVFFNNFFSINAIDLKLYDFSYKYILHLLAKLRYPTYCQSENIGHNLKPPIQFFWKN